MQFLFMTVLFALLLIAGCATTGGFKEARTEGLKYEDLKIYGKLDEEFSSKYFGSLARSQTMDHINIKAGLYWKF